MPQLSCIRFRRYAVVSPESPAEVCCDKPQQGKSLLLLHSRKAGKETESTKKDKGKVIVNV
jgi:hypothetical protein